MKGDVKRGNGTVGVGSLKVTGNSAVRNPTFIHFDTIRACDRLTEERKRDRQTYIQTDRQRATAHTTLVPKTLVSTGHDLPTFQI